MKKKRILNSLEEKGHHMMSPIVCYKSIIIPNILKLTTFYYMMKAGDPQRKNIDFLLEIRQCSDKENIIKILVKVLLLSNKKLF